MGYGSVVANFGRYELINFVIGAVGERLKSCVSGA